MRARLLLPLVVLLMSGCIRPWGTNLHEVHAGKLYRSAQLTGEEFEEVIRDLGIKTIVNLQGQHLDEDWYLEERAVAKKHGVQLVDIGMSAQRLPHKEDLILLLDTFRDAKRPMLIHCRAGADRTGEAATIYQMVYMGKTRAQALNMLRLAYDHAAIFTPAKRYFMKEIWQGEEWARETYDPLADDQVYDYYDREKYAEQRAALKKEKKASK